MTTVEFFTELSEILGAHRVKELNRTDAENRLNDLSERATVAGIHYDIDKNKLLDDTKSGEFDEEMSYEEPYEEDESYESSYDDDENDSN